MATGNQALFAILMLMTAPNKVMPSNVSCDCLSMQALMMMVQHLTTMTEQQASTIQAMQSQMTSLQTSVHQQSSAASDHIATLAGVGSRPTAGVNDANKKRLGTKASGTGSAFVRWGKSQCPTGVTTVYSGYAGGGNSNDPGAGANRLCMASAPVYDDTAILSTGHGTLYGAQYHISGHNQHTDVVCSLCHTSFSATFMVPGTNRCPNGTIEQYHGYLSVGNYGSTSASEFVCLDSNPEDRAGSSVNQKCAWFDHTATVCGSLPCPPYVSGKAVTCVVCSK